MTFYSNIDGYLLVDFLLPHIDTLRLVLLHIPPVTRKFINNRWNIPIKLIIKNVKNKITYPYENKKAVD